jgi:hypothetical protein
LGGPHPPIDNQSARTSVREEQRGRPTVANPIVACPSTSDDGDFAVQAFVHEVLRSSLFAYQTKNIR